MHEWGMREDVVEKDYIIGWLLWGIGSNLSLSAAWAFKGGTCLKKCYLETYRFSEDLDFTVLPGGPVKPGEVEPLLQEIFGRIYECSGINFREKPPFIRMRPDGRSVEGRVYYRGPRNAPDFARIKIDLTTAEQIILPTVPRQISHPYPDPFPAPATIRCYSFAELFAEKIRAMGERSRPRDLYDIINLFRRKEIHPHAALIHSVYHQKCESKGIEVFTFHSLETSRYRIELETEWANMLGHQLPVLPPFDDFWQELPNLFGWLDGKLTPDKLTPIPFAADEEKHWSPPPAMLIWGQKAPLEPLRFAAANHLCVNLGYEDAKRLMEPYCLRQAKDGYFVLHAMDNTTGELRTYRIDRLQSIQVTRTTFKPRHAIELISTGPLIAT
jgi:predicted nucleotidyltransferase component of viral defense system